MIRARLLCFLLFCCWQLVVHAQWTWDEAAFRAFSETERYQRVQEWSVQPFDSATFQARYQPMLAVAQAVGDRRTEWRLRFELFQERQNLHLTNDEITRAQAELQALVQSAGLEVEQVVTAHYVNFEAYNSGQMPYEQLYSAILHEFEHIEVLGFERFRKHDLARMLYHSGRFLFQLEDFEKALHILLVAEQYADPSPAGRRVSVLVLNHIQTIYQQEKNYAKGIEYAQKVLARTRDCVEEEAFCETWQTIASVDVASMLVGQGQAAEGERYANAGYRLVGKADFGNKTALQTEYDVLQVLISVKLELGKLNEAAALLRRVDSINAVLDRLVAPEFFKHARFYELCARFYEMKGDYAASVRYANRAKPLRDSLERRNDARKLEKIQQRLDAEKYIQRLREVEQERQWQRWLMVLALVGLVVLGWLAWANYRRLLRKRNDLAAAQNDLVVFTNGYREKSEQVEQLRLEIEQRTRSEARNEYLEQLTHSTILTDADWVQFRALFEKVHPQFIAEQRAQHPDLTPAETRLLVLEKLGLNTQEMANMLGVSKNTIHQTRLRLRRKVGGATS